MEAIDLLLESRVSSEEADLWGHDLEDYISLPDSSLLSLLPASPNVSSFPHILPCLSALESRRWTKL